MDQGRLGRYRILGVLGRGAMGVVYRAEDPLIEREVAIKTLNPDLPEEVMEEVRERFLREAKSAGRLNHPNVVTIYDVGEQDQTAYIAMELIEGSTLQQMLRAPERLPLETVVDLAAQIAEGLDHAQRFAIVHRDVKPGNVMVSPSGRAKLTDFGVAYVPSSEVTQVGTALGSPRYMSPEQVLGLPIDPRSDIFSLGSVLYEMLTGRTPFERPGEATTLNLMNRIAREPHVPVSHLDPSIPSVFDRILARALAKNAAERYSRAGDMAEDLRNFRVPGHSVTASAPDPDESSAQLLQELEAFSRDYEQAQEARARAEREQRQRKEEALRAWAESEARKQAEFERQRTADDQAPARRAAALEMLRSRAPTRSPDDEQERRYAEMVARVDRGLRAAYQYFTEFAAELNRVLPTAGHPLEMVYLRQSPHTTLSDAFADYRTHRVADAHVCDYVVLRFKARYAPPPVIDLAGQDIQRCTEYLAGHNVPYELRETKRNDFGQITHATLALGGLIPCEVTLRGDLDAERITIDLVNVRKIGRARLSIDPEALTDELVDQLGTYLLGLDSEFGKHLGR
ncbi:MAG: protein kinase domain-containing protein [Sphingomonadaceae bacterium]